MQEALRQGCRRSLRLLAQRGVSATAAPAHTPSHHQHHHVAGVVAAGDGAADNTAASADAGSKRRRRRVALPTGDSRAAAAASSSEPLGALTNKPDQLAAAPAAGAGASSPPAKKARRKPAAAAANADAAAQPAAAQPAAAEPGGGAASSRKHKAGAAASRKPAAGSGPSRAAEAALWARGFKAVAGVDEAGRGPLAGPVVAAAAVLPRDAVFEKLNDSKQMSEADREELYEQLTTHPGVAYAVAVVDHSIIDDINILQAALLAMTQAVEGLEAKGQPADHLLIDGNKAPPGLAHMPLQTIVKGDASSTCIAAASVIAKVTRDRLMLQLDEQYPQYGFAQHKGYGVPAHKTALKAHGPCPVHRRSFEPVKSMVGFAGYANKSRQQAAAGSSGGGAAAAAERQS